MTFTTYLITYFELSSLKLHKIGDFIMCYSQCTQYISKHNTDIKNADRFCVSLWNFAQTGKYPVILPILMYTIQ